MKTHPYRITVNPIIREKDLSQPYHEALSSVLFPDVKLTANDFSDFLIQAPADYDEIWARLTQILIKAFEGIVSNYFKSKAIREIYDLSDQLEAILQVADGLPYQVGMFRPDFLLESETLQPRICEIGARYPINGWICSYFSQQILSKLNASNDLNIGIQHDQLNFPDVIANSFKPSSSIALIDDKETGTEVFSLINILEEKPFRFLRSKPENVTLEDDVIKVNGKPCDQFIMELDRTKLLHFKQDILKKIITSCYSVNDVRSIILVHDKRVLAVLQQHSIMKEILSDDEMQFLAPFLIPTFTLNNKSIHAEILSRKNDWIFKKNSGGGGVDAYQSAAMTDEELTNLLGQSSRNYIAQHFVNQAIINAPDPHYMVGILLQFNNHLFGAGIFRGGFESIVNISGGNGKIYPSVLNNSLL